MVYCDALEQWSGLASGVSACVPMTCDEWSSWADDCDECNNLGEGTTRRFRICEGGEPQWDEKGCSTGCNNCMKPVKVNTAPCRCRQDSARGVAMVTSRCLHLRENVTYLRQTPGPCGCEGCRSAPGKNGATCIDVDGVDYACHCPPLFTGEHCAKAIGCVNHDSCYNGAECQPGVDVNLCMCPFFLTGALCEELHPCGGWMNFHCHDCDYWFLLSVCMYNGTKHTLSRTLWPPTTDYQLRALSLIVAMLLDTSLTPEAGNARCTWGEWLPCQYVVFGQACGKLRRKYCHIGDIWLPVDTELSPCKCLMLTKISRRQWSQWTSPSQCWPSSCRQRSFQTRERRTDTRFRRDVTDLRLCPPSDGSTCDQETTTDATTKTTATEATTKYKTTTATMTAKATTWKAMTAKAMTATTTAKMKTTKMTPGVVPLGGRSGSVCPAVHARGTYLLFYCVGLGLVASLVNT